jgi:hypothetical protein
MALLLMIGSLMILGIFYVVFRARGRDMDEMPFGKAGHERKRDDDEASR